MRLLLGGFEPFGGETLNPSMLAVERVRDDPPAGVSSAVVVLPVRYDQAWYRLLAALQGEPDIVLLTGLAGGRSALSMERLAVNLDDAPMADNAGERRQDLAVVTDGPAAYFTTLPARRMAEASNGAGVPASVSDSAGTFLCNHVLYRLCHHATTAERPLRCGFVHLPWLPEQAVTRVGAPSMELTTMVRGLRAAIAACRA